MVVKVSEFDLELLRATKEVMVVLIEKGRVGAWTKERGVARGRIVEDTKAIADALRGAVLGKKA